jgi:hypothetical protein
MNRLEKTLKNTPDNAQSLKSLKTNTFGWLFLKDGAVMRTINSCFDKMVAESDGKIDMKIVLRDENEELMNLF